MTLYANKNLHICLTVEESILNRVTIWGELQQVLKSMKKTIQYNFYASYHGHNVCDAVASHAKSALKKYQLNYDVPVPDQAAVVDVLTNIPSSIVTPSISGMGKPPKVPTLKGISSYHCFKFPQPGQILVHHTRLSSSKSHVLL